MYHAVSAGIPLVGGPGDFSGCSKEDSTVVLVVSEGCAVPCPVAQVFRNLLTGLEDSRTPVSYFKLVVSPHRTNFGKEDSVKSASRLSIIISKPIRTHMMD